MKAIVLTGGRGYLGRNIIKRLSTQNFHVISVYSNVESSHLQTQDNESHLNVSCGFDSLTNRLKNYDDVTFLHFTTEYSAGSSGASIERLLQKNILFGIEILSYMLAHGYSKIIVAESYWQFDSASRMRPLIPYSKTKTAFSLICESYQQVGLKPIFLVLNDVYGPKDERQKIVNMAIRAVLQNVELEMTSGKQVLDFVYVDDVVDDVIYALKRFDDLYARKNISRYNITSNNFSSLKDLFMSVDIFFKKSHLFKWGRIEYSTHQIFEPWIPNKNDILDNSAAKLSFNDGINKIMETSC